MEDSYFDRVKKGNVFLFAGSLVLVLLFVAAVKLNVYIAVYTTGKPMPGMESALRLNPEEHRGKVTFLYFWRDDIDICNEIMRWTIDWDSRYRQKGLAITVVIPAENAGSFLEEQKKILAERGVRYEAVIDIEGKIRKELRHGSFATYYLADRLEVIRSVGNGHKGREKAEELIEALLLY